MLLLYIFSDSVHQDISLSCSKEGSAMGTTFRKKQAVTDALNSKMEEVFRRAEAKRCSSDRCTNQAQNGGVCMRHGAKGKRKNASVMDVRNLLFAEECAGDMGD